MNVLPRLAAVGVLSLIGIATPTARAWAAEDWLVLGKTVATEITERHFDKVEARFDAKMAAALPAGKLGAIWDGLLAQTGPFRGITGARDEEYQGYRLVYVSCKFDKAALDAKLVFDHERHLAGLFFVPSRADQPAQAAWGAPDYARPASFHERAVVVGKKPWQLPGTLTLPNGAGPFPVVVLVHGSGPEDADETIGPNKPFKDLAWGLASRGVAVLRYVKRTAQHGGRMRMDSGTFTVAEETVDDARLALALAAQQPEIDARGVYLLGHSLGGMLAPRIAQGAPQVAGLIVMAGNTRPLFETVVVEQVRYLASLDSSGASAGSVADVERAAREIASPGLTPTTIVKLLGTALPGSYFLDLRGYQPAAVASGLGIPILVLQGARDYQVTVADFDGWKAALAPNPRARFQLYPALTHLFMPSSSPGSGLGTPADYDRPGHVDAAVVDDIAKWVAPGAAG